MSRALRVEPVRKLQVEAPQFAPALQVERVQKGHAKPALVVETLKTAGNPGVPNDRDTRTGSPGTPQVELAKIPTLSTTKGPGLALGASVAALVAYDGALKVEKIGTPKEKATAWRALAEVGGKNPYRKMARARAKAWEDYSRNRAELHKAVAIAWTKLTKLLPLSVLDISQKKALVRQFRERFRSLPRWLHKLRLLVSLRLAGPPKEAPAATIAGLHCLATRDGRYIQARRTGKLSGGAPRCGIEQTFVLVDADGGKLSSGDRVFVRSPNGRYWTSLATGHLVALRTSVGLPESFTVIKVGGVGPIVAGDRIALRSLAFKKFVVVPPGGSAHARSRSPGARGTFLLQAASP